MVPCRRKDFPARLPSQALIVVLPVVAFGCAGTYQGYKLRSIAYEYSDPDHKGHERRAFEAAQDECYNGGDMYAQPAGPPKIVSDGTATSPHFRATLSYYCIGARGED